MLTFIIVAITIAIAVGSYFVHPQMESWIVFSISAYAFIAAVFITSWLTKRRENRKKRGYNIFWEDADDAFVAILVLFSWYAIISLVSYCRIVDAIIYKGPAEIAFVIVGIILLAVIAWICYRKRPKRE